MQFRGEFDQFSWEICHHQQYTTNGFDKSTESDIELRRIPDE